MSKIPTIQGATNLSNVNIFALQFKKRVDELGVRDKNYIEILGRDIGSIISNAKICPNYTALLKLFLEDND